MGADNIEPLSFMVLAIVLYGLLVIMLIVEHRKKKKREEKTALLIAAMLEAEGPKKSPMPITNKVHIRD